jgi:hypothetical protein
MTKIITARSPLISFILLAVLMGISIEGRSMGLFDFLKVVMASEFNGVVTLEGKPLADVKVTRSVEDEDIITQETTTDANGRFKFDALVKTSLKTLTPLEPVYGQKITIHYDSDSINAFSYVKRNYFNNGEFWFLDEAEKKVTLPLNFTCEITEEDSVRRVREDGYTGVCVWQES